MSNKQKAFKQIYIPAMKKITQEVEDKSEDGYQHHNLKPPDRELPEYMSDENELFKQFKVIIILILAIVLLTTTTVVFAVTPSNSLNEQGTIMTTYNTTPMFLNTAHNVKLPLNADGEELMKENNQYPLPVTLIKKDEVETNESTDSIYTYVGKDLLKGNLITIEHTLNKQVNKTVPKNDFEVSGNAKPDATVQNIVDNPNVDSIDSKKMIKSNQIFIYVSGGLLGIGALTTASFIKRYKNKSDKKVQIECSKTSKATTLQYNNTINDSEIITPKTSNAHSGIQVADLAYIEQGEYKYALSKRYQYISTENNRISASVSIVGNRDENQDYVLSFEINSKVDDKAEILNVMVVADGCGGHIGGKHASYLAVKSATEAIIEKVDSLSPEDLLKDAFIKASEKLEEVGSVYWGDNELRTTLLVTIATKDTYYHGWIGDGGALIKRKNGNWLSLLEPHKAGAQNLLSASLGPKQMGEPSFVKYARESGDMFLMGTDGVFDVIEDNNEFWSWFEQKLQSDYSPQLALEQIVYECAEHEIFDDNLTVAYLGTVLETKQSQSLDSGDVGNQSSYSPIETTTV